MSKWLVLFLMASPAFSLPYLDIQNTLERRRVVHVVIHRTSFENNTKNKTKAFSLSIPARARKRLQITGFCPERSHGSLFDIDIYVARRRSDTSLAFTHEYQNIYQCIDDLSDLRSTRFVIKPNNVQLRRIRIIPPPRIVETEGDS